MNGNRIDPDDAADILAGAMNNVARTSAYLRSFVGRTVVIWLDNGETIGGYVNSVTYPDDPGSDYPEALYLTHLDHDPEHAALVFVEKISTVIRTGDTPKGPK